ncbi:MAG: ATP-binding protein [Desulfovibrionaceae bacterium]
MRQPHRLHLDVPPRLPAVGEAVREAGRFLHALGAPGRAVYAAELVLEELMTNAVKYGGEAVLAAALELELALAPEEDETSLVILLADRGEPFDPTGAAAPVLGRPLEETLPGGLGLYMVRTMTSRLEYRREADRNVIRAAIALRPGPWA